MKRLIDYINQSTQIDVDNLLPKISHISFNGIPNRKVTPGSKDAFDLAKDQESFVINTLSKKYNYVEWVHNDERSKDNLENGNILCKIDNKIVAKIDIKVASKDSNKSQLGTIDVNSVMNFSNKPDTWYICINNDGSRCNVASGEEVYKVFMNTDCVYKTNRPDRDDYLSKDIQKYASKVVKEPINDGGKTKWVTCQSDNISDYDFIPSKFLVKYLY